MLGFFFYFKTDKQNHFSFSLHLSATVDEIFSEHTQGSRDGHTRTKLSLLLLRNICSKCKRADVKLFTPKQGEAFAVEWFLGNSRHKKDVN